MGCKQGPAVPHVNQELKGLLLVTLNPRRSARGKRLRWNHVFGDLAPEMDHLRRHIIQYESVSRKPFQEARSELGRSRPRAAQGLNEGSLSVRLLEHAYRQ